ncbi:related to monocarboxylate transporter [Rhynchosporium graminicola]|uniref:Related to monocarboxylate transporter n=1 Tax=Rhynchosporium graminicola TaxID=2792576 RepID=A0A1E1KAF6_9HELO|nr:related to monocarboxylate transporter [Rhynchosporium commune]
MDLNNQDSHSDLEKASAVQARHDSLDPPPGEDSEAIENTKPEDEYPDGGLKAWLVVAGAAGVLFCGFGHANAVYQEYYSTHQLRDEAASTISWIGSLQLFFLFGGNLIGGPLFDRYGSKIIWPAILGYILAMMMTSLCTSLYQFLLAQGILGGISLGLSMAPAMAATGQYFDKKRGAAMGLAIGGSSIGGVLFPIILSKMLNSSSLSFGWTVRILGFIMIALMIPAGAAIRPRLPPRKNKFFLPEAFKDPQYSLLIASTFLMMIGMFMPFFYLPTFAVAHGMNTQLAGNLLAILNAASFFGRVIPGVLGDKLGRLNALCAAGLSTGILVLCMQILDSNASFIVFAVLYGFCSGAIISGMAVCLAQITPDPRNLGTYMGMGMAVIAIAALIGPPIDGALVDKYHSFDQVATFSGVLVLAGGFGVVLVKHFNPKGIVSKA